MNKISIATSEGKIWNLDSVIVNIIAALRNRGKLKIDLLSEGPCLHSVGLVSLLDDICEKLQFDQTDITIFTSNQIKSSHYNESRSGFVELEYSKQKAKNRLFNQQKHSNRFGLFVGRSNWKRLAIAAYLWHNYRSLTCMSFHFAFDHDFHKDNFGLEELLHEIGIDDTVFEFIKQLPIKFDHQQYPILWNINAFDLESKYDEIFCDIVCETFTGGKTFFVTEKTFRPIANKKPFIIQGAQWYLENLKKLGFKTFSDWWPEGYDQDLNGGSLCSIKDCIDYIAEQDQATINRWEVEMMPVLQHNFDVLCSLTNQQILLTEFQS